MKVGYEYLLGGDEKEEDTPANLALLLGPLWEMKDSAIVNKTRIEVLLCPPPGLAQLCHCHVSR